MNRSALLVTLAPLEGNEDFDALSSGTNILYVAAVAGLSASKKKKASTPRWERRKASAGAGRRASETRRREKENPPNPAPGRRNPFTGRRRIFQKKKSSHADGKK